MEHEIGEIFEYNGEWYQCIEGRCRDCYFSEKRFLCKQFITKGFCTSDIIFKKLEKVGEPVTERGRTFHRLKPWYAACIGCVFLDNKKSCDKDYYIDSPCHDWEIWAEIKQNQEEKKLNLKPFDIQKAREGKPVCTRDGRKARIICWDRYASCYHIVALIECKGFPNKEEEVKVYTDNGKYISGEENAYDLMMLPEKKEGWVNVYRDCDGVNITKDDNIYSSKDAAISSAQIIDKDNYVATAIIKWEE